MNTLGRRLLALPKGLWRLFTFLRATLVNLLFFVLLISIGFFFFNSPEKPSIPQKGPLIVNLNAPLVDHITESNGISSFINDTLSGTTATPIVIPDLIKTLNYAKTDDNITGLILKLSALPNTPLTQLQTLGNALKDFKNSKKPIYVTGDRYSQSQYYLAAFANEVWLAPDGLVTLKGYQMYNLYYADLLKKLEITPHIFRVGSYKSAVEPYLQNTMSEETKRANQAIIDQIWQQYRHDVAQQRNLPPQQFSPSAKKLLADLTQANGDPAQLAKNWQWVDRLMTLPQQETALIKAFHQTGDQLKGIPFRYYQPPAAAQKNAPNIAIIAVNGAIMEGSNTPSTTGSKSLIKQIRQARFDDNIKSVVLRINSPGGSVFASEQIRNELEALKSANKKIVASMGSMAASGGYWIATPADKILAMPTTLTGSIGIFAIFPTIEKALESIGIHGDGVGTTPLSTIGFTKKLSPELAAIFQLTVDHGYRQFIQLVQKSRNLTAEQTENLAQGRVWTGIDAKKLGLIDELGGLDRAIEIATNLANIKKAHPIWLPEKTGSLKNLMSQWQITAFKSTLTQWMGLSKGTLNDLENTASPLIKFRQWQDPKGQYAFCLNCNTL